MQVSKNFRTLVKKKYKDSSCLLKKKMYICRNINLLEYRSPLKISVPISNPQSIVSEEKELNVSPKEKRLLQRHWLLIAMGIAVLLLVFLLLKQRSYNRELTTYFEEEQLELEQDFRLLIEEYDSLQVANNYDSLLLQLDIEQQRVTELLDELETVKASNAAKLREYRKELSTMRKVMKHYVVQIDSLNAVNQELTKEVNYVKAQYKAATKTVVRLEEKAKELNETIAIASQLEAKNLMIEPLNAKGRKVRKLSKTARFKISFTVAKNITTQVGDKVVYLRVTSPQQEVLPSAEEGHFQFEDAALEYSAKRQFEYEAEDVNIEIFYAINQFLFAGEYAFDLFVDGVHIGHGTLEMKE